MIEVCNLSARLDFCKNLASFENSNPNTQTYSDYFDKVYILKWLERIGQVAAFSPLSGVAFILNFIIIFAVKSKANKREKIFKAKMFNYTVINSVFNCIECMIHELRLIHICIYRNSVFCSSIKSLYSRKNWEPLLVSLIRNWCKV